MGCGKGVCSREQGAKSPDRLDQGEITTATYRVGIGYDCHRLEDGGPLRIGGCDVPFHRHLAGHSDADVLLHAITDAVLGGGSLGDIGEMFPNTDPANRGRDSAEMLRAAYERVRTSGLEIVNLDCVVHAEQPQLVPYRTAIRRRVAESWESLWNRSASRPRRAKE